MIYAYTEEKNGTGTYLKEWNVAVRGDKIYLTDEGPTMYFSGARVCKDYEGTNQITLPLRHFVDGLEVK